MTKPDPDLPDPETPDPDPADAQSPAPDASGAQHSGATPPPESNNSPDSSDADAEPADDDAVWLDLVARLEGVGAGGDEAAGHPAGGTDSAAGGAGSGRLRLPAPRRPGRSATLTRWVSPAPRRSSSPPRSGSPPPRGIRLRAATRYQTPRPAPATMSPTTTTAPSSRRSRPAWQGQIR